MKSDSDSLLREFFRNQKAKKNKYNTFNPLKNTTSAQAIAFSRDKRPGLLDGN